MWRRIVNWYDDIEREQIAVLERPELAAQVRPGFRRYMVDKLATMTPIERQQLREFCVTYQGRRLWMAIAKLALLFTVAGALVHAVTGKGGWIGYIFLFNLLGFCLTAGGVAAWFDARRLLEAKRKMLLQAVLGALIGAGVCYAILVLTDPRPVGHFVSRLPQLAVTTTLAGAALAIPFLSIGAFRRRQQEALMAQLLRDAEAEKLARELSDAQLRMLRAQIEPHFLFNTLGAVQQLAADGAPRAAALTADLIAFLRASFSDMRCEQVSLATEFATTAAYLRVMQARMGARLRVDCALPEELASARVPSMIVLTLAENAIKHGIEPSLRGGGIRISAEGSGDGIHVRVEDSGVGMSDTPGDGAGLDNVRRRLQLAFGGAARLQLRNADPGVVAELTLPFPEPVAMKEMA